MDLKLLRKANIWRDQEWDPEMKITLLFRGNELAGEAGEACNKIKKLERERLGLPGSRCKVAELAEELADVIICADLIAMELNIDLSKAVIKKFNKTSDEHSLITHMGGAS